MLFGFSIAPNARIGFSIVLPKHLTMASGSKIGHLNVIKSLDVLELGSQSKIGNLNWITGTSLASKKHFEDEPGRESRLVLGAHASMTARHFIDCANLVSIGGFSTIAGANSQILTHGIDLVTNRQRSAPVMIGSFCMVGTGCVILKGAKLPDFSVLAANSTLHRAYDQSHTIYSGVPAVAVKLLPEDAAYFHRETGAVP